VPAPDGGSLPARNYRPGADITGRQRTLPPRAGISGLGGGHLLSFSNGRLPARCRLPDRGRICWNAFHAGYRGCRGDSGRELDGLFADGFTPVLPRRLCHVRREPPAPGQWSQWEAIWRKAG
jgi:hypothetical protein